MPQSGAEHRDLGENRHLNTADAREERGGRGDSGAEKYEASHCHLSDLPVALTPCHSFLGHSVESTEVGTHFH